MEPIADPSEFQYVLELIREDAAALPVTQDTLRLKLDMLIADALSDLTGPSLEIPRDYGDLDDASSAWHLRTDYHLTTNEEAAADWLLTLYLARDHLDLGFGIDAAIESIEAKGWIVLAWRFWGSVFDLDRRRRQARTAARDPKRHERLCRRARLLLECGTYPHKLVSKLEESDVGAGYSKDWIRIVLQKNKILKKRKTNKRR